jgi:4-hydroxybenzoate polyprenyltransferase
VLGSYFHFEWSTLPLVVGVFMLARISGMAFNQLIDRYIDVRNPRTQNRPLPLGKVSVAQARTIAWGTLSLFTILCLQMNTLTALLAIVAAPLLYLYSYMKRVHASCHLVLASIHFLGPMMAFTAVTGSCIPSAAFLGAAAALSILGTDIIYAIQDYEFDCAEGLFSIPSRLGIKKSILIAQVSHGLCLFMLFCTGWFLHLPLIYYLNLLCAGTIFGYFHYLAYYQWKEHKNFHEMASFFFWCNVGVSGCSLLFILISRVWVGLL